MDAPAVGKGTGADGGGIMAAEHPKIAAVKRAAVSLAKAIGQREATLERCRALQARERRLALTAAVEQEEAAFSELCLAMYDQEFLDFINSGK